MASTYVVGSLDKLLKKSDQKKSKNSLQSLFSVPTTQKVVFQPISEPSAPPPDSSEIVPGPSSTKSKKQKKSKKSVNDEVPTSPQEETKESQPPKQPKQAKKAIPKAEKDPASEERTIFVGNLPVDTKKKELLKLFRQFGAVESLRFRGAIPVNAKINKEHAMIKRQFNEMNHSICAFIKFKDEESAVKACVQNGEVFKDRHLRVDKSKKTTATHETDKSIFVGNLPFDLLDEELFSYFQNFGDVESVRIIRDMYHGVGKGFGYVHFKNKATVQKVLSADQKYVIKKRTLRVKKAEQNYKSNPRDQSKSRKHQNHSTEPSLPFQGSRADGKNVKDVLKKRRKAKEAKRQQLKKIKNKGKLYFENLYNKK